MATSPKLVTLAIAVAVAVGLLVSQFLPQWREEPGPRLRRECVSLVDTALTEDRTVSRLDLEQEIIIRGVDIPPFPVLSPKEIFRSESKPARPAAEDSKRAHWRQWAEREEHHKFVEFELSGKYEAAKEAYDARWDELRSAPAYNPAWEAAFDKKRSKAIKDCILKRAVREGVSIR